jgi:hypothetical protein
MSFSKCFWIGKEDIIKRKCNAENPVRDFTEKQREFINKSENFGIELEELGANQQCVNCCIEFNKIIKAAKFQPTTKEKFQYSNLDCSFSLATFKAIFADFNCKNNGNKRGLKELKILRNVNSIPFNVFAVCDNCRQIHIPKQSNFYVNLIVKHENLLLFN